jgi:aspartyl-tRNA(Asn)/glutamyl-tRNA(Gln) amidotransferase subunit A
LLATVDVMADQRRAGLAGHPCPANRRLGPYHQAWGAAQPRSAEFTMPMDLAGVPALSLPCGFSGDGLPYNLQFTGRRLSEAMLCRVAYAYEQATEWRKRHPPIPA